MRRTAIGCVAALLLGGGALVAMVEPVPEGPCTGTHGVQVACTDEPGGMLDPWVDAGR